MTTKPQSEQRRGPVECLRPFAHASMMPLFHAAWIFALGIVAARWMWLRPGYVLLAAALSAAVCCLAAFRAQRVLWVPLAAVWFLLGAWCAEMELQPAASPKIAALSDGLLRTLDGTVVSAGAVRSCRM